LSLSEREMWSCGSSAASGAGWSIPVANMALNLMWSGHTWRTSPDAAADCLIAARLPKDWEEYTCSLWYIGWVARGSHGHRQTKLFAIIFSKNPFHFPFCWTNNRGLLSSLQHLQWHYHRLMSKSPTTVCKLNLHTGLVIWKDKCRTFAQPHNTSRVSR
jgi:hypothetical protein